MTDTRTDISSPVSCPLTMGKEERLRHKRLVDRLFREGKSFYAYPLRVVYSLDSAAGTVGAFRSRHIPAQSDPAATLRAMGIAPVQMMVSIPKRKMRHAVDRVWLRRRVREAWRLARVPLRGSLAEQGMAMSVALVYIAPEKLPYRVLEQRMAHIMERLARAVQEKGESS